VRGYLIISIYGKNLPDVWVVASLVRCFEIYDLEYFAEGTQADESGFKFTLLNYPKRP